MDCGSAICGVFAALSQPAGKELGMEVIPIKAGLSADSVNAAFDTVVQAGYDGVDPTDLGVDRATVNIWGPVNAAELDH